MHGIARAAAGRLFLVSLLLIVGNALATPPTPPVRLVLPERLAAVALRDGRLQLPIAIETREAARDVVVSVYVRRVLPGKPDLEQPRLERVQQLKPKAKRGREALAVRLEKLVLGEYVVQVRVDGRYDGSGDDGFSDVVILHLLVDSSGRATLQSPVAHEHDAEGGRWRAFREDLARHPDHPRIRLLRGDTQPLRDARVGESQVPRDARLEVRAGAPSADLSKYYRDRTADAWQPEDPLTVQGRLLFMDVDGILRPLVNVSVHVWDEDTYGDELLGGVASGWDGRWSFSVNNDDGALQDGRDIYYTFTLTNTRLDLSRCNGDYRWQSAVREDRNDGSVVDFGDETAGSSTNSLVVWDRLNLSWNKAATTGGRDPGMVAACFPASATEYGGTVNVTAADFDGDGPSHEYGHALMDKAYSEDISPGLDHGFSDCNQDQGQSWSEGWATGFMLATFPDERYNWHFGDEGRKIEKFSLVDCDPVLGEKNEGFVAAALLDFIDVADDDSDGFPSRGRAGYGDANAAARVSLATIYRDTMWGSVHFDVLDFWYDLAGSLSGDRRAGAAEIMYYAYMSVVPPDSCVATKAATARLADGDAEIVLDDLRRFRDQVLERGDRGRELVNRYYRNSPEMAALLLADAKATDDALYVIRHFASFGATVTNNRRYRDAFAANAAIVAPDVDAAVGRLFAFFAQRGGATLKADVQYAQGEYARVKSLTLPQLQQQLEKESPAGAKKVRLAPGRFSPESERALETPGVRALREKGSPKPPAR